MGAPMEFPATRHQRRLASPLTSDLAGGAASLTDTVGHVVTGTIPNSNGGSVGVQFPLTCQ
jgi:hypothetical protein